jgi:hypothetical protein
MLDFTKQLVGLDGIAVKDSEDRGITLGQLLSGQLAQSNKGDALKLFTWAQKLYNGEPLDLDPSDKQTLEDFIKNNEALTVLAKAQLLSVFKN